MPAERRPGRGARGAALLVGNYLPSLAAARTLAAAGYRVIAGDGGEFSTVWYSRHCSERWRHPPIRDSEGFIRALVTFLASRPEIRVVVPLQERYVAALAPARGRLPSGVILAAPDATVVRACLDKTVMHRIATEAGVPSRPIATAADLASLHAAADQAGYPCVIRPATHGRQLPGGAKALVCRDRATVTERLADWPQGLGLLLVQPYVAGRRHNVAFIAREGTILARLGSMVLRTDRIDDTGVAVEEVVVPLDPRLAVYCDAMIERLDYTGVGSAQFIVPDVGDPSFLEINPRHDSAAAGLEAFGLPLTLAAIGLASSPRDWRPALSPRSFAGRRYAWTSRDLYALGMAMSRGETGLGSALRWLGRALGTAARADVHLTWSWRDPLPTLAVYAHLATFGPWRRRRRAGPEAAERDVGAVDRGRAAESPEPHGDHAP